MPDTTPLTPERRAEIERVFHAELDYMDKYRCPSSGLHKRFRAVFTDLLAAHDALVAEVNAIKRKHDNVVDARDYWIKQAQSAQDEARHHERRAEDYALVAWGLACGVIRRGADQPTGDALMDSTWWLATGCPGEYIGMGCGLVPVINEFTEARSVLEQSAKEQLL